MASNFSIGDLVWAKMKGFPPWPGLITEPTDELKKASSKPRPGHHCIFFFGTRNYSWIEVDKLKSYEDFKEEGKKYAKSASFIAATREIEEYKKGDKTIANPQQDDPFDKLIRSPTGPQKKAKRSDGNKKKTSISEDEISSGPAKAEDESSSDESSSGNLSKKKTSKSPRKSKGISKDDKIQKVEESPRRLSLPKSEKKETSRKRSSTASNTDARVKRRPNSVTVPDTTTYPDSQNGDGRLSPNLLPNFRKYSLPRTPTIRRPETPPLNIDHISETLKKKDIKPSDLKFGFIGLGIMGSGIVKNLMNSGHKVVVWNRSPEKCDDFAKSGAEVAMTPGDVVSSADITYCCVSDIQVAKELVFGNCGVLYEMTPNKAYVEMSGIDAESSHDIAEAIYSRGGRYLEVRFQGSRKEAEEGSLVILAAGDRSVYNECESCFNACSNHSIFLGEVGTASKMNLIVQLMVGVTLAGIAEGLALADRCGLSQSDLMEILKLSSLNCSLIMEKCKAVNESNYTKNLSLAHLQKDVKLALNLGDQHEQRLTLTATANELYIHTKRLGYRDHDSAAIFLGAKM